MATRFWVGGTGTWDNADTTHWAAGSAGAGGQSVPVAGDTVTFDGSSGGGTVTVNHATLSILSLTVGAFTGTLDFATNNNNITVGTVSLSGTGARTINLGNGTWTITATTGTVWDNGTITSETLNANSSTIDLVAVATVNRTFIGGGKTYNAVKVTNAATSAIKVRFTGNNTFASIVMTNLRFWEFAGGSTQTVSGAITYAGSSTAQCFIGTDAVGTSTVTLSVASAITFSWVFIQSVTKAGAGSIAATSSFDGGNNSGVTITGPSGGGGNTVFGGYGGVII